MSITKLPNGRLRAQVYDVATGKNVSVARVLGLPKNESTWPTTRQGKRDATAAREKARMILGGVVRQSVTVDQFRDRWLNDRLFARPKESTMKHYDEATRAFAAAYGSVPMAAVGDQIVGEWLAGGHRNWTARALRAMFNDAQSPKAGRVVQGNPFANLNLGESKGNRDVHPPSPEQSAQMIELAHKLAGPSFAGWLAVACATGMRPGELDALQWDAILWDDGLIHVREQYNSKTGKFTPPKNGKTRHAILTAPARAALLGLPREADYCFVNRKLQHWTLGSREHHWDKVQAKLDLPTLYLCTRHYAGWYMVNVLRLLPEDVAVALGHEDGGYLVRRLYGHLDKGAALARVAKAYEGAL